MLEVATSMLGLRQDGMVLHIIVLSHIRWEHVRQKIWLPPRAEPNRALWLATRAGKMEHYLARSGLHAVSRKKNFPGRQILNIGHALLVKVTGYWPRSFFATLWISTPPRSNSSPLYLIASTNRTPKRHEDVRLSVTPYSARMSSGTF